MVRVGVAMVMQSGAALELGDFASLPPAADIELAALGRALWRRKVLILGLTLLAAASAFATVNFITPMYRSEARVSH